MNFMVKPIHFCEIPKQGAVCGYPLLVEDWSRYYNETTNCFANITCEKCQEWVRHNRLSPRGFPDPAEWTRELQIDAAVRSFLPWFRSSQLLLDALVAKFGGIFDIKIHDVDDAFRRLNAAWWNGAWRLDRPSKTI